MVDTPKYKQIRYHRRSIRMKGYDYSLEGAYFVTIATYQRKCLFGEVVNGEMRLSTYGLIAQEQWNRLEKRFPPSDFSAFVIMPNHVHGIIHIVRDAGEEPEHVLPEIPIQRHGEDHDVRGAEERFDPVSLGIPSIHTDNKLNDIPGSEGVIHNVRGAGEGFKPVPSAIPPQRPYNNPHITSGSLGAFVRSYKGSVTYRINAIRGYTNPPIWQRNYYEHIIRNEKEYQQIKDYIVTNPATWMDDRFYTSSILV